jgi:hypothetical protein
MPVEKHLAGVHREGPGQGLDERGLPGPVVSDDRQDFAGVEVEVDAVQADDATECLDQAAVLRCLTGALIVRP